MQGRRLVTIITGNRERRSLTSQGVLVVKDRSNFQNEKGKNSGFNIKAQPMKEVFKQQLAPQIKI